MREAVARTCNPSSPRGGPVDCQADLEPAGSVRPGGRAHGERDGRSPARRPIAPGSVGTPVPRGVVGRPDGWGGRAGARDGAGGPPLAAAGGAPGAVAGL